MSGWIHTLFGWLGEGEGGFAGVNEGSMGPPRHSEGENITMVFTLSHGAHPPPDTPQSGVPAGYNR